MLDKHRHWAELDFLLHFLSFVARGFPNCLEVFFSFSRGTLLFVHAVCKESPEPPFREIWMSAIWASAAGLTLMVRG